MTEKDNTYYKLKKDLPTFKAGDMFYVDGGNGNLYSSDEDIMVYHSNTLEKFPEILDDWFEETSNPPKKNGRILVGKGEYYYAIDGISLLSMPHAEDNGVISHSRYEIGNYFVDGWRADLYCDYKITLEKVLSNSRDWTTSASIARKYNYQFTIFLDEDNNLGVGNVNVLEGHTVFPLFFKSREAAKESLTMNSGNWTAIANYDFKVDFYH